MCKKWWSRCLCLCLTAVLLLGGISPGAAAAEDPLYAALEWEKDEEDGQVLGMLETREGVDDVWRPRSAARSYSAPDAARYDGGDMYSQLSDRQKAVYRALDALTIDELVTAAKTQAGGKVFRRALFEVEGFTGTELTGAFLGASFVASRESKEVESDLYTDLCAAIVAFRYDRADALWMGLIRYGYKIDQADENRGRITYVTMDFHLEFEGREKEMWDTMMANARDVAEAAAEETDTYSRLKRAYATLAQWNSYSEEDNSLAHLAYSALITGDEYQPVCEGYAKAMKIIADLMGIPCVLVTSRQHMWNCVKMDDGEWYLMDLTWDDSGDRALDYRYFLVGSQTVVDGQAFSSQAYHVEEDPYAAYQAEGNGVLKSVTLRFPAESRKAYEYLGEDYKPLTFPDVKRSDWFYEPVEKAVERQLFTGDSSGKFLPRNSITRGQFALVMARALGADLDAYEGISVFPDVPAGLWYSNAVAWARDKHIMNGDRAGTFRPKAYITRQEMCVVLCNATAATLHKEIDDEFRFSDDGDIAEWARDAVYECHELGFIQGVGEGRANPLGLTRRSEAAAVFVRFAAYLEELASAPEQPADEEEQPPAEEETAEPEETENAA